MTRRVVLHVGAHKTGTTVIQQYLVTHPRPLRDAGIRYLSRPELTPMVGWGDRLVAEPERFRGMLDGFAAGRERTLLASHENMCGPPFVPRRPGLYPNSAAPIDALAGLLSGFDTTILLTVRPVAQLAESYYLQQVNMGASTPFERWVDALDLDALSWRPLVTRLRNAFERVAVIDFAAAIRPGSARFVHDVMERCGIHLPLDATWSRPLNPSVSGQGMRLLVRGNEVLDDAADRIALRSFVQRHYSNAKGERPTLLDAAAKDRLHARFADEYAELTAL